MRFIILIFVLAGLISCQVLNDLDTPKVVELAKVQHQCTDIKVLISASDWKVLDVCGTKRYYDFGVWCSDCSSTWRERKLKQQ